MKKRQGFVKKKLEFLHKLLFFQKPELYTYGK